MDKQKAEHLTKQIPAAIKNAVGYLKQNFDENGQEILGNASGTLGLFINLLGKPLLDKYYDKLTKNKLENFGFQTYLKASFTQVQSSIKLVETSLKDSLNPEGVVKMLIEALAAEAEQYKKEDVVLLFRPVYHPMIVRIRDAVSRALQGLSSDGDVSSRFTRDFNKNILQTITESFGEQFEVHQQEIKEHLLEENESQLLYETIQGARIGFKEGEDLLYQEPFGSWMPITSLTQTEQEEVKEDELVPVEELIDRYFEGGEYLKKILFLIADFGKGKSVFMRNYAARLAREYIDTRSGLFPVYFNLRDFKNYSSASTLGVLDDYLQTDYGIKIDSTYFKQKKYIFLIDSLDESGELTENAIKEVISSVKAIQNLDKELCRDMRLVITSRPISDGLSTLMKQHHPFTIEDDHGTGIPQYMSVYGFTQTQFNDWIAQTIRSSKDQTVLDSNTLGRKINKALKSGKLDIYKDLLESKTLSKSELRRPIFAYMIYQLVLHNVDFMKIGKIGVYLSFLNLLTREAKPYYDKDYEVDLSKELEFRKLLHAIAVLWTRERQKGRQGVLKKADICRAVQGKRIDKDDDVVLQKNRGSDAIDINFLSHSYFGENQNKLHFQHQSFAEILLAEYYLKVFLKFALEEERDIDQARAKLLIGEPTGQTIGFLKEMLVLLREVANPEVTTEVIEKRKLLFPLVASLAIPKNNPFYCAALDYRWFRQAKIDENTKEPPKELLKKWPIDADVIEKVVDVAADILKSKTTILQTQSEPKTSLYHDELISLGDKSLKQVIDPMDKWLALLVGNTLFNDEEERRFFNREKQIPFQSLLGLIEGYNYANKRPCPRWVRNCFMGVDVKDAYINTLNIDELNFSYSKISNTYFKYCSVRLTDFSNCQFSIVHFNYCDIQSILFDGIKVDTSVDVEDIGQGYFSLALCFIHQGVPFPGELNRLLKGTSLGIVDLGPNKVVLGEGFDRIEYLKNLKGIFNYLIDKLDVKREVIAKSFEFSNHNRMGLKKEFEAFLREL